MINRTRQVGEQLCGRRGENPLSNYSFPPPDHWELGRWAATQEEADADQAEFMAAHPTGGMGNTLWPGPGEQPRTCSFCGGVHPDDAIRLIQEGWEVEGTTKGYKRYLQPPGYEAYLTRLKENGYNHAGIEPGPWSPIPPVKLYVQHFSPEQIDAFNRAVEAKRAS